MYGPAGERRLTELELPWLPGYEGSAPVRIGNAASDQFQLDVYGEVMDALQQAREGGLAARRRRLAAPARADRASSRRPGSEPDEGIWEVRGERRHFAHSKVMAWVAFDRAVRTVELFGTTGPVERWRELRDRDPPRGLRARLRRRARHVHAVLRLARARRGDADDPARRLPAAGRRAGDRHGRGDPAGAVRDGFVLRYDTARGRRRPAAGRGRVPALLVLARRLPHADRPPRRGARALRAARWPANDVGLLAEEYDPRLGPPVGNFPQAFTHVGLVNTARNLDRAARPQPRTAPNAKEADLMRAITIDPGVADSAAARGDAGAGRVRGRDPRRRRRARASAGRTRRSSAATTARRRPARAADPRARVARPGRRGAGGQRLRPGRPRRRHRAAPGSRAVPVVRGGRVGLLPQRPLHRARHQGAARLRLGALADRAGVRREARSRARAARGADGADDDRGQGVGADRPDRRSARRSRPQRVLVTGAGPIGLLAALLGVQRGLEVHVLDRGPRPEARRSSRDLGATYHAAASATSTRRPT